MNRFQDFTGKPTPFYFYDINLLTQTLDAIKKAAPEKNYCVHYAVKANSDARLLQIIASNGFGADCVSGGEIRAALAAGFEPEKIAFAGVGKTDEEINLAMDSGIWSFNVESLPELEVIAEIARRKGVVARVALRVNPNIDAHTHHYITTGLEENKFGISLETLDKAVVYSLSHPEVALMGLHFHIGSQILTTEPYRLLCERINNILAEYSRRGISFASINVGGGLGIDYDDPDANPIPPFEAYFDTFRKYLHLEPGQTLHFELGRAVVAQCGSLITRVLYVKPGIKKNFVIVDAGMTDLIRPALYQAHHKIENITSTAAESALYDVVGPVCESSDCFGTDERLPLTVRGDILAIRSAGAYGQSMASQYNCRELPRSVYSD